MAAPDRHETTLGRRAEMPLDGSRRMLLAGGSALALTLATRLGAVARAEPLPEVTVHMSPT